MVPVSGYPTLPLRVATPPAEFSKMVLQLEKSEAAIAVGAVGREVQTPIL
jgi:hypothetical protein